MIKRELSQKIKEMAKKFPIVSIIGPRQSGKTTLTKALFPKYKYVSLEDLDNRTFANEDPRGFLQAYDKKVIIDEAQRAPDLFSYLQTHSDNVDQPGQYILTGSQNFLLHEKISQSLAGRVRLLKLLPFNISELRNAKITFDKSEECILNGFYPRLYDKKLLPNDWYSSYVETYLERDVRKIINVSDLSTFQKFLKLSAGRTGQILNLSSLAVDTGISHNTARSWLSILEASYIAYRLPVYFRNYNKRLIKSPKLYFYDVGLASYLLGIDNVEQVRTYYQRGALFETLIMSELVKRRYNNGKSMNLYYWRDKAGHEVDCVVDKPKPVVIEIKSGSTINESFFKGLKYWGSLTKSDPEQLYVAYNGSENQFRKNGNVISWNRLNPVLDLLA